jgi:hypothetical protein
LDKLAMWDSLSSYCCYWDCLRKAWYNDRLQVMVVFVATVVVLADRAMRQEYLTLLVVWLDEYKIMSMFKDW